MACVDFIVTDQIGGVGCEPMPKAYRAIFFKNSTANRNGFTEQDFETDPASPVVSTTAAQVVANLQRLALWQFLTSIETGDTTTNGAGNQENKVITTPGTSSAARTTVKAELITEPNLTTSVGSKPSEVWPFIFPNLQSDARVKLQFLLGTGYKFMYVDRFGNIVHRAITDTDLDPYWDLDTIITGTTSAADAGASDGTPLDLVFPFAELESFQITQTTIDFNTL